MSATWGVITAVGCLVVCEAVSFMLLKKVSQRKVPYEVPHIPLFLVTCAALYSIEKTALFPPALLVLIQFGMLYCLLVAGLLFLLLFVRHVHYQSYIFILNWLKR